MATIIRPELSKRNKYWIDKNRYYELKHFCLQYLSWKKAYKALDDLIVSSFNFDSIRDPNRISDTTSKYAIAKSEIATKIEMIENAAKETDEFLAIYILKAVTEGLSFNYLKTKLEIPCSKDTYYDRYRKFFWVLHGKRN